MKLHNHRSLTLYKWNLVGAVVLIAAVGTTVYWLYVKENRVVNNPVAYFEIPAVDMNRAVKFYSAVFGYTLERQVVDGYEMANFPFDAEGAGITGALAKGDVYVPTKSGAIVYFSVPDIEAVLKRAKANGGGVLYEKKSIGELGFVAEIEDTEGNRIALHSK